MVAILSNQNSLAQNNNPLLIHHCRTLRLDSRETKPFLFFFLSTLTFHLDFVPFPNMSMQHAMATQYDPVFITLQQGDGDWGDTMMLQNPTLEHREYELEGPPRAYVIMSELEIESAPSPKEAG